MSQTFINLVSVFYEGKVVGNFFADLLVEKEKCVLVELKALNSLDNNHQAQCLNYLKASNLNLCLLINFGKPKVKIKRIIYNPQPQALDPICVYLQTNK